MRAATKTFTFRKTATCPASTTLLSFRSNDLSAKAAKQVKEHLDHCDFCNAELPLLAHHSPAFGRRRKPPEMPMNLRILAESILCHMSSRN
jgi:hypothetical protein